jgi:hypothetical protein
MICPGSFLYLCEPDELLGAMAPTAKMDVSLSPLRIKIQPFSPERRSVTEVNMHCRRKNCRGSGNKGVFDRTLPLASC